MTRVLAPLLAALAALVIAAPASAAPGFHGMSGSALFDHAGRAIGGTDQLDRLARSGVSFVRTDAPWATVEPWGPGTAQPRRWAELDRKVAELAARGLRWLPVAISSPQWTTLAPGTVMAPPADAGAYGLFVGALVQRYGPGGTFWLANPRLPQVPVEAVEIWNEPNIPRYWATGPDPALYAEMYMAARGAVEAVAPDVQVLIGGLSPYRDPVGFLQQVAAARPDLPSQIDGVGIHPYARGASGVIKETARVRAGLRGLGVPAVPLWVTELGWPLPNQSPTAFFALPDRTRAGAVALTSDALAASDCNVRSLGWFTWTTGMSDPAEQEEWYGFNNPNLTPTSAVAALQAAVGRPAPQGPLNQCGAPDPAPPLPLGLEVTNQKTGGKNCLTALVTYRGDPVNAVNVHFDQGRAQRNPDTGDEGTAQKCFKRNDPIKVRAANDNWAASPVVTVRPAGAKSARR